MKIKEIPLGKLTIQDYWGCYSSTGDWVQSDRGIWFGYGDMFLKPWLNFVVK